MLTMLTHLQRMKNRFWGSPNHEVRGTACSRGYGHKWRKLRRAKLARVPVCEGCMLEWATNVHHINKIADGGNVLCGLGELQALCHSCHSKLTGEGK